MTLADIHTAFCVATTSIAVWLVLLTVVAMLVDQIAKAWSRRREHGAAHGHD
jgi:hypothetical protein